MSQLQTKQITWLDEGGCGNCDYCGMDMEMEPYCVHPLIVKKFSYGLNINKALKDFCRINEVNTLYKKRKND